MAEVVIRLKGARVVDECCSMIDGYVVAVALIHIDVWLRVASEWLPLPGASGGRVVALDARSGIEVGIWDRRVVETGGERAENMTGDGGSSGAIGESGCSSCIVEMEISSLSPSSSPFRSVKLVLSSSTATERLSAFAAPAAGAVELTFAPARAALVDEEVRARRRRASSAAGVSSSPSPRSASYTLDTSETGAPPTPAPASAPARCGLCGSCLAAAARRPSPNTEESAGVILVSVTSESSESCDAFSADAVSGCMAIAEFMLATSASGNTRGRSKSTKENKNTVHKRGILVNRNYCT